MITKAIPAKKSAAPIPFRGYTKRPVDSFVVDIAGGEGKGKTYLALTSPHPAICDTERKSYRVIDSGVGNPDKVFYPDSWQDIEAFAIHAVEDPDVSTIIFDTLKEIEEMALISTLETLGKDSLHSEAGAVQYKYVNAKLEGLFRVIRMAGKSAVTTARVKDEYVGNNRTGRGIRDGWSKMPYYADFCLMSVETIPGVPVHSLKPATYIWKVTKNGILPRGTFAEFVTGATLPDLITQMRTPATDQYLEELKRAITRE